LQHHSQITYEVRRDVDVDLVGDVSGSGDAQHTLTERSPIEMVLPMLIRFCCVAFVVVTCDRAQLDCGAWLFVNIVDTLECDISVPRTVSRLCIRSPAASQQQQD